MADATNTFFIKTGNLSPSIRVVLKDAAGNVIDLTGIIGVTFTMSYKDMTRKVDAQAGTVVDAEGGIVQYDWQSGDTDEDGLFYSEWDVTYASGKPETFPNVGFNPIQIGVDL